MVHLGPLDDGGNGDQLDLGVHTVGVVGHTLVPGAITNRHTMMSALNAPAPPHKDKTERKKKKREKRRNELVALANGDLDEGDAGLGCRSTDRLVRCKINK